MTIFYLYFFFSTTRSIIIFEQSLVNTGGRIRKVDFGLSYLIFTKDGSPIHQLLPMVLVWRITYALLRLRYASAPILVQSLLQQTRIQSDLLAFLLWQKYIGLHALVISELVIEFGHFILLSIHNKLKKTGHRKIQRNRIHLKPLHVLHLILLFTFI